MYKFCTLYSGSSGNSTYIGNENEGILVDIGKNAKQTQLALAELSIPPESVRAIFITHEHIDHVAGLRVFCNKYHIPVFASFGTLGALENAGHLKGDFQVFQITDYADVGDFHIDAFHTMHDSAESMGYSVMLPNGIKTAVATDLGIVTEEVKKGVMGARTLLLESNHDIRMLETGPYPYYLKRRILSETGHLCNDNAAELAIELVENGAEQLFLGHLSQENNVPDLAYQTTASRLKQEGANVDIDYRLAVAKRNSPTFVNI